MPISTILLIAIVIVFIIIIFAVWRMVAGFGGQGGGRALAPAGLIARGERGDVYAQKELGYIYATGASKVRKNLAEAVAWYERAAKRGDAEAQNAIGSLYARGGEGLMQNHRKAAACFEKAAEKGLSQAQINLAAAYEMGQGVLKSYITAYMWYTLAYDNADSNMRETLSEKTQVLTRSMTPEQVMDAKKRAAEWRSAKRR